MVPAHALPRLPRSRSCLRRRRRGPGGRSFLAFLLVACFGILFAGCGGPAGPDAEEFAFTADDVAKVRELITGGEFDDSLSTGAAVSAGPTLGGGPHLIDGAGSVGVPVLDVSARSQYDAIRSGPGAVGDDLYRVTNAFLNVRNAPLVTADQVDRLVQGDVVTVLEFVDAAWARVRLRDAREGYVAQRYIARMVSEDGLAEEKAEFQDLFFVNFGFLNVRRDPDANSEKIGELPGQALLRPLSLDEVWARIPFEGGEGYVAVQYLKPFLPNFLVRQNRYPLPILHYRMAREGMEDALAVHVARLQQEGVTPMTLRDFRELVLRQEERDVRLEPKRVVIAISDVTTENLTEVSDVLRASGVKATLFIRTGDVSREGISDQNLLTLVANGFDIQSAAHTGDDLRSLTNAQIELEMAQSRQILEQKTGRPVFAIAYPMGGVNGRVEELAAGAGYLFGLGSGAERTFEREQFLRLPGFTVSKNMTEEDILSIALGTTE